MKRVVLSIVLGCCGLVPLQAAQQAPVSTERLHWEADLSAPLRLVIHNAYGDVRLRQSETSEFIYHAVSQYTAPHQARLDVVKKPGEIHFNLVYDSPPPEGAVNRIDLALIVPAGLTLDIRIENGTLSSKSLHNPITARSQGADIKLKSDRSVDLFSQNGDIDFTQLAGTEPPTTRLQSHTGTVTHRYSLAQAPKVEVHTGGMVTSNSVELLRSKNTQGHRTLFNQESHSAEVHIKTDTGSVALVAIEHI